MNIVYLVRHGENQANITREFSYRRVDYPLTERGKLQTQQTASYLRDKQIDAVYSSPLRRAMETAAVIARDIGLDVTVVEHFREVNVGLLEDEPPSDEAWAHHDWITAEWRAGRHFITFPGGEDYAMLVARFRHGLSETLRGREGQRIVIVGHGGIFTGAIVDLCPNARGNDAIYGPIPNCAIGTLEVMNRAGVLEGTLLTWADATHLRGAAAP